MERSRDLSFFSHLLCGCSRVCTLEDSSRTFYFLEPKSEDKNFQVSAAVKGVWHNKFLLHLR